MVCRLQLHYGGYFWLLRCLWKKKTRSSFRVDDGVWGATRPMLYPAPITEVPPWLVIPSLTCYPPHGCVTPQRCPPPLPVMMAGSSEVPWPFWPKSSFKGKKFTEASADIKQESKWKTTRKQTTKQQNDLMILEGSWRKKIMCVCDSFSCKKYLCLLHTVVSYHVRGERLGMSGGEGMCINGGGVAMSVGGGWPK